MSAGSAACGAQSDGDFVRGEEEGKACLVWAHTRHQPRPIRQAQLHRCVDTLFLAELRTSGEVDADPEPTCFILPHHSMELLRQKSMAELCESMTPESLVEPATCVHFDRDESFEARVHNLGVALTGGGADCAKPLTAPSQRARQRATCCGEP